MESYPEDVRLGRQVSQICRELYAFFGAANQKVHGGEENAHSSIGLSILRGCYSKNDGRGLEQTKFAQDVTLTTPACTHRMPTIIWDAGVRESCN